MGVAGDLGELVKSGKIISKRMGAGTRNMATGPAMSRNEAIRSLEGGIEVALELGPSTDIFGTGDMGIGNTSPSAAIIAIFSGSPLSEIVGRGQALMMGSSCIRLR